MVIAAAILLIIPGFITDIVGLLLLLPPVRDFAWGAFRKRIVTTAVFASGGFRANRGSRVVDLDADDFSRTDGAARQNPGSPWRRLTDE
jgi:UPF0716 protein FxsA